METESNLDEDWTRLDGDEGRPDGGLWLQALPLLILLCDSYQIESEVQRETGCRLGRLDGGLGDGCGFKLILLCATDVLHWDPLG